jgi:hypothetical protein
MKLTDKLELFLIRKGVFNCKTRFDYLSKFTLMQSLKSGSSEESTTEVDPRPRRSSRFLKVGEAFRLERDSASLEVSSPEPPSSRAAWVARSASW